PGRIFEVSPSGIRVSCGENSLLLQQVQLPGKKPVSIEELLRGHPALFSEGEQLELPVRWRSLPVQLQPRSLARSCASRGHCRACYPPPKPDCPRANVHFC